MYSGLLVVALIGRSPSATIYTAPGGIIGNWTNTTSWLGGVFPGGADTAYLRYGDTIQVDSATAPNQIRIGNGCTLNLNSGADVTVGAGTGYVYVGYYLTTAGNNNLTVSAGASLNTGRLYLGDNDGGTVIIAGGAVTVNERIFIGNRTGSAVAATQTGGTVSSVAADINFADAGANGTYALNGGVFQTTKLSYRRKFSGTPVPFTMGSTGILKTSRIQYLDTWGTDDVTFIQAGGILDPAVVDASGVTSEIADMVLYNTAGTVNYTMGAGAVLALQISGTNTDLEGPGGYDQISVDNVFTANGTLRVTLINGFTPALGDIFDLLDAAAFSGSFITVSLPALPTGLGWNTDALLINGSVSVVTNKAKPSLALYVIYGNGS